MPHTTLELPEKRDWEKLRQIRREIELYEKKRREMSHTSQNLEVEREKIEERLGELWYEFRRLYTGSSEE
jgi:septal ring factor EnvC (AmiA/AmiB activator)